MADKGRKKRKEQKHQQTIRGCVEKRKEAMKGKRLHDGKK